MNLKFNFQAYYKKLIIIDLSSLIYRYFFTSIKNNHLSEISFIFYAISKDIALLRKYYPDALIIVVLDHKTNSNSRKKIAPNYKANRKISIPKEVWDGMYSITEFLQKLNISVLQPENIESDDLISYIAKEINIPEVYIYTRDKDILQIAHCKSNKTYYMMLSPSEHIEMRQLCYDRFNIDVKHLVEYFSVVGDVSDNIPGVPGLGPAFVKKYITKYNNISTLYNMHIDTLTTNERKKLSEGIESYKLSKRLFLPQIPDREYLNNIIILNNKFDLEEISNYLYGIGWISLIKILKDD